MEVLFLSLIAVTGSIYHIAFRKRSDFLTISFFSMIIYFFPGFVGLVTNPYYPRALPNIEIQPETYYVFYAAMVSNVLFCLVGDFVQKNGDRTVRPLEITSATRRSVLLVLTFSFALAFVESGWALLSPEKDLVLESRGRFLALFSVVAQVSLLISLIRPDKVMTTVSVVAMAFLVFIGFRSYFAITIIGIIAYFIMARSVRSFLNPIFAASVVSAGIFLLTYKQIYVFLKMGRLDLASQRVGGESFLFDAILSSEPFITQFVLNETIIKGYSEPALKIFTSGLLLVPGLTQIAGLSNDQLTFDFQNVVLPTIQYGIGYNIYAHWFASLGWAGILLFLLLYNTTLAYLSTAAAKSSGLIKVTTLLIGSMLAFYINRNNMFYTMQTIERYIVVGLILGLVVKTVFGGEKRPSTRQLT